RSLMPRLPDPSAQAAALPSASVAPMRPRIAHPPTVRRSLRALWTWCLMLFGAATLAPAAPVEVGVELPVPARINTRSVHKILVAQFAAPDHASVDVNKEFVRFVRRELAKGTSFEILDVDPPALPEQPIEDLLRNDVFWKHLGEEYGADLIVS